MAELYQTRDAAQKTRSTLQGVRLSGSLGTETGSFCHGNHLSTASKGMIQSHATLPENHGSERNSSRDVGAIHMSPVQM